ncbi:sulfotransferase [Desulforhopalus sp. IMCC35007]|uniref:sulfotransferase family protein n=1 Tax=Desulforhopalus sp. IMCC35007 TaxID=2569543 RepID=UPI0010AEC48B|nr:sulfotransferase [Desulforhopalus sp. IMCC35007]TKB07406.1 sulfotransferase [Desulforhopalus sp. IMCC35007]
MLQSPVFILGCPRSGTTLLAELLEFSLYGKPFETHFITKYYKLLSSYGDISQRENFRKLVHDISVERVVSQWKVDINADHIYDELDKIDYSHICDYICRLKSTKKGYVHWGDKTPTYTLDLDIIHSLFPEAKYIFIVRDGRDVALSLLERPWGPNNIFCCAELWKKYNTSSELLTKLQNNDQLLYLKYEDLLRDAKKIVPNLYSFLDEKIIPDECAALIQSIRGRNFNKWKTRMSHRNIKIFENMASTTLDKYGYTFTYDEGEINWMYKKLFKFHEFLMRLIFLFKLNIIDGFMIKYFNKDPFAE